MTKVVETVSTVAIRFAGDSGDGMQLTGTQFTDTTALGGQRPRDVSRLSRPRFAPPPARWRRLGLPDQLLERAVYTPGDAPDVLVAMNPAALKTNLEDLKPGGMLILNTEAFNEKNLERAGYKSNPLDDGSLANYRVFTGRHHRHDAQVDRGPQAQPTAPPCAARTSSRSASCTGCTTATLAHTLEWIDSSVRRASPSRRSPTCARSRPATTSARPPSCSTHSYEVRQAKIEPGRYRNISGNEALALGLLAAAELAGSQLFLGSYPITPASDVLHALARHKHFGVHDVPGRRRDRRGLRRDRRELRGRARAHHDQRPRHRAQGRGDRPGGHDRAAAGGRQRPARRPEHRPADQDRAGRPAAGACTAATASRRCRSSPRAARATLLRGDRGVRASRSRT